MPKPQNNVKVSTFGGNTSTPNLSHPSGHKLTFHGDFSVFDETTQQFISVDSLVRKN